MAVVVFYIKLELLKMNEGSQARQPRIGITIRPFTYGSAQRLMKTRLIFHTFIYVGILQVLSTSRVMLS